MQLKPDTSKKNRSFVTLEAPQELARARELLNLRQRAVIYLGLSTISSFVSSESRDQKVYVTDPLDNRRFETVSITESVSNKRLMKVAHTMLSGSVLFGELRPPAKVANDKAFANSINSHFSSPELGVAPTQPSEPTEAKILHLMGRETPPESA